MASSPAPANLNEVREPFTVRSREFFREYGLLIVSAFIALLVVSAEGRRPEATDLATRRQEIESLSSTDRSQLKTNVDWWRGLTQSNRESVREIHQAIATDPQLDATLKAYRDWLDSIPGKEKSEVLAIADPAERLKKIAAVQREQDLRKRDRDGRRPDESYDRESLRPGMPRLSPRDFHNVMVIIGKAHDLKAPSASASSEALFDFHLKVFEEIGKGRRANDENRPIFEPSLVNEIADAISMPFVRDRLKENTPGSLPMLLRMLASSLIEDVKSTIGSPTAEDRQRLLKALPESARRALESEPPDAQERHLLAMFLKEKSPTFGSRFFNFVERTERMRRGLGRPEDDFLPRGDRPDFGGPPQFGPNPRRRGDEPGGDRPPPPRNN